MAFNAEVEMKALRGRVDGLERKVDTLEKSMRALPDTALMAKLATRLDAAEKAIAGKKDAKTADQEAIKSNAKMAAEIQAMAKEQTNKALLETRLKVLESQVQVAMAAAGASKR
jgi:polyhydroxyalkanoate synthesis regulator phasin